MLITEILFDQPAEGADFVELMNRSKHALDLQHIRLCRGDAAWNITDFCEPAPEGKMLLPGRRMALTTNKPWTVAYYAQHGGDSAVMQVSSMPNFPQSEGQVMVSDYRGEILDRMSYRAGMHHPMLNNRKGVSLERVRNAISALETDNWHSAAATAGYGTPGLPNSQECREVTDWYTWHLDVDMFTPDGDGDRDLVSLLYRFTDPGAVFTVSVFDAGGRKIKKLAENRLAGTAGVLAWDGTRDDGMIAPIGNYIVLAEFHHPNKPSGSTKFLVTLGGRM
jgi:hypothetical protein